MKILKTKVEVVTPKHGTPYLKKWTLHSVEISENKADEIAKDLSQSLDFLHNDWYADFKNDTFHYVIFHHKVFKVDRSRPKPYSKVVAYGLSLGIPDYQLDFSEEQI